MYHHVVGITEASVRDALSHVIDPELGINVVDLGLVYGVEIDGARVRVRMTMTTPACPLGAYITDLAEAEITARVEGVDAVAIELVWEPAWGPELMSPEAQRQLGH